MFVLSCSMKILALGFHELLKSIFCLLLIEEAFSLQKVVEVLQELVVSWWEVRWIWQMSQNFITQFIQLLKHWLWDRWLGIVMENWALSLTNASCRHYSFQWILSICWVYFYDIMISLGFRELQWIRLAADYQNSAHNLFFFWCNFGFRKCFGASSQSNNRAGGHWLSTKIHFSLHIKIW